MRKFTFAVESSSGEIFHESFNLPVLIYRGIFKEGTEYQRGDVVMWGGSAWHCNKESTRGLPRMPSDSETEKEIEPDWKMIVKRGGEGKQGIPGPQGPQGPKGKDGGR